MLVLGVTGGIGTGKTTVSSVFRELGAEVVDADKIAHELLGPAAEGAAKVREQFGQEFIDDEGGVRRGELGKVVFADEESRRRLEAALHPLIIGEIRRRLKAFRRRSDAGRLVVVVDAPVLLEADARDLVDRVVVVWARRSTQKGRSVRNGGLTEGEVEARLAAQMPLDEKVRLADFVVDNDGDIESTKRQVAEIWSWARAALAGDGGPQPTHRKGGGGPTS